MYEEKDLYAKVEELTDVVMACMVQLSRIYDVIAAMATKTYPDNIVKMLENHESGQIFTTEPTLKSFGEPD